MKTQKFKPIPEIYKDDLQKVNDLLLNALYHTQSNIRPSQRFEIIKSELIEALKLLPVNNLLEITKYC